MMTREENLPKLYCNRRLYTNQEMEQRGVSHCALVAIYIKRYYLKAKEELYKLKYFIMQKYNLQKKNPSKRNQNASRYIIIL